MPVLPTTTITTTKKRTRFLLLKAHVCYVRVRIVSCNSTFRAGWSQPAGHALQSVGSSCYIDAYSVMRQNSWGWIFRLIRFCSFQHSLRQQRMALCVNKEWLADTETHHARFVFDPKTTHERPKRIEKTAQFIVLSCLGAFEKSLLQFESSCDRVASLKSTATQHVFAPAASSILCVKKKWLFASTKTGSPTQKSTTPASYSIQKLHMNVLKELNKLHSS